MREDKEPSTQPGAVGTVSLLEESVSILPSSHPIPFYPHPHPHPQSSHALCCPFPFPRPPTAKPRPPLLHPSLIPTGMHALLLALTISAYATDLGGYLHARQFKVPWPGLCLPILHPWHCKPVRPQGPGAHAPPPPRPPVISWLPPRSGSGPGAPSVPRSLWTC